MERDTYQSTIKEINALKKEDTIDKLIQNTLKFKYLNNMGLNTKNLTENFNTFIANYSTKLGDIIGELQKDPHEKGTETIKLSIQNIFEKFNAHKFDNDTLNEYNQIKNNVELEHHSKKEPNHSKEKSKKKTHNNKNDANIDANRDANYRILQYTRNVLVPYFERKIKIYKHKKKISNQQNNIDTVLEKLGELKTINSDILTSETLYYLSMKINKIIKKYADIIHFFNIDESKGEKETIIKTLKKLKNKPSESQYRQYTYKKS